MLAAVFSAGEGAVLGHLAAAELRRVARDTASLIDVVVPRKRSAQPGVRIHEVRRLDPRDVTTFQGIPITTVARMFVDLTETQHPLELANVIHEAAYKGWFSVPATRDAMARANGRHKLHVLERAIEHHLAGSAGFRSRGEARLYAAIMRAGLPEPLVNTHLNGEEADFHWPAHALVVEVDGPGHGRPRTQTRRCAQGGDVARRRLRGPANRQPRRHPIASDSSGRSVMNMCPGAWVIISSGWLAAATACGVTPHAQNTGTSPERISTASPYDGEPSDAMPSAAGSPT